MSGKAKKAPTIPASKTRTYAIGAVLLLAAAGIGIWLYSSSARTGYGEDSPTGAYKRLFAAVKSKDTEAIKSQMTKKTVEFASMVSQRNKTPIEKVFENGFTMTTFSETLPTTHDERIAGDMASVEVWNSKDSKWEDLPFMREDGAWKLAVGELFSGTFKADVVGPGRAIREAEAANMLNGNQMVPGLPPGSNGNMPTNANVIPIKPRPANMPK